MDSINYLTNIQKNHIPARNFQKSKDIDLKNLKNENTLLNRELELIKKDILFCSELRTRSLNKGINNGQILQAIKYAASAIWDILKKSIDDDEDKDDVTCDLLGVLLDIHSCYTAAHSDNVTDLTMDLALELGMDSQEQLMQLQEATYFRDIGQNGPDDFSSFSFENDLEAEQYTEQITHILYKSSHLHDIGKLQIPSSILNKTERLTDEEFAEIKLHPLIGVEIVTLFPHLHRAIPGIRGHHERWNGTGYPDRKKGEDIPLEARIICICDSFEAMTSARPYHEPMTYDHGY